MPRTPPTDVETIQAPLSPEQRQWIDAARARLNVEWIRDLLCRLVEIPSPYGEEAPFAAALARELEAAGLEPELQELDPRSANVLGRLRGGQEGADVLLFAPLDSPFTGRAEDDVPWVGDSIPDHMQPKATVIDGHVRGLSAHNPKGHIVALIAAAKALKEANVPLRGSLTLGFGAGGAPANPRPGDPRPQVGHGRGCVYMLDHGLRPDFALVAKPGFAVAWEEVGVAWFRLRVRGTQTYVGRKHLLEYRNPIALAAPLVTGLEKWFPIYAERHTDGLVAPQGAVSAIHGGWPNLAAFVPAACDVIVDMRLSPRTTPEQAKAELEDAVAGIVAQHPGLEVQCDTLVAVPGAGTAPDNWIIQSSIRAWEDVEGRRHKPYIRTSGQTEAVILRNRGIPTARMGLAQHMGPVDEPQPARPAKHTMGAVALDSIDQFARALIYLLVDTGTRPRDALGL
jgi:acetylornithine deacetylase/succinyl-diaminopimelate desuccinylase-like protein